MLVLVLCLLLHCRALKSRVHYHNIVAEISYMVCKLQQLLCKQAVTFSTANQLS